MIPVSVSVPLFSGSSSPTIDAERLKGQKRKGNIGKGSYVSLTGKAHQYRERGCLVD